MKSKQLFTKMLLVALCLIGGSGFAWGEATTIYEKAVTSWASSDVTKTELTTDKWYNSDGVASANYYSGIYVTTTEGLRLISRNGGVKTTELSLNRSENTIITIDAVWNAGAANSDSNTPYNIFTYGDFSLKQTVRSNNYKTELTINGVTTTIDSNSKVTYREDGGRDYNGNELTIHLKVNSFNGTITEFYILAPDASNLVTLSDLTSTTNHFASGVNYDIIKTTTYMSGSSAYAWNALKSITVKEEAQTIYTYKINAVDPSNNILETLYEYQSLSEETITQYWKKGLNVGGVWYMADAQTSTPHYGHTFTTGETHNVTFRPTDAIYYAEAEDIESGLYNQVNCEDYTSNGNARFFQANKNGRISTNMSLAAGVYDVFVAAIDRSGKSATLELYKKTLGDVETKIGDVKTSSNNYLYPNTFSNINFEAGEELYSQPWTNEYNATFLLDYITVAKSKVPYKVEYKCGETTLKTADATRTAVWGTKVEITEADMADIADATLGTYEYASDNASEVTIAMDSSSVITVQFTIKNISYTVKAVDQNENELTTLTSGEATADGSTTAYWSKYIKVDGQWYETVDATYGKAIKVADNTVTYKASKISYFNEGETMTGYNAAATQNGSDFSGGVSGRHKPNTSWTTTEGVAAGSYIISFPYKAHTSSSSTTVKIYEVKSDESTTLIEELSMTANSTYTKYDVELAEGSKLRIANETGSNSNWCIDYVTLTKLYEQTTVTGAETWDWSKTPSTLGNQWALTDNTIPKKDTEFLLKNIELYGLTGDASIPANFGNAQHLKLKGEYPFRYVDSKGMFQGNTVKFTTDVPGILTVDFSNTGTSDTRTLYVNGEATSFTTNSKETVNATEIAVPAGEVVITGNRNGSTVYLRFYKITFTPTAVKATINPTYGMATFSSTYALDFTGITTLTAYQATACDGEKVTLEPVTGVVAANTGLLISGETTNIPISSEAGTSYSDPDCHFFACNGSFTEVGTPESGTNFVLSVQGGKVVFAPIGSTPAPIKAGQAALWANFTPNASRTLHISFGDDATDIRQIENGKLRIENSVYDLQGRRVSHPTKGLHIKDGKVVVVK